LFSTYPLASDNKRFVAAIPIGKGSFVIMKMFIERFPAT
jgi:hypothetical protein